MDIHSCVDIVIESHKYTKGGLRAVSNQNDSLIFIMPSYEFYEKNIKEGYIIYKRANIDSFYIKGIGFDTVWFHDYLKYPGPDDSKPLR